MPKQPKNTKNAFFACFRAFVRQPHDFIGSATSLHQSILLTQGLIHEVLVKIAQLLVVVEKLSFFESAISDFFFQKKKICFIPIKISQHLWDRKDF